MRPWWNPRKSRKPGTRNLMRPWRDSRKKRKIETLVGPLENLKSGTRYRSGTIRLKKLVPM